MKLSMDTTIAISDLRRRFGEIEKALPFVNQFVLTKKGRPFAILSATPMVKKELVKTTAGTLKGTSLDNDILWKETVKKKSRKQDLVL